MARTLWLFWPVARSHPRPDDHPLGPGTDPRPFQGGESLPGGHPEIVTEQLPSYAPETNPDENVWQHTKHARLANFAPEDTRELRRAMIEEFDRLHGRPDLLAAFIRHARIPVRLRRLSG